MFESTLLVLIALGLQIAAHEAGHALAARGVGFRIVRVRWSLLAPGVMVTDGRPDGAPGDRLRWTAVHLAGPMANLALVAVAAAVGPAPLPTLNLALGSLPATVVAVGWFAALVSLAPLPMTDGGRAILALTTAYAGPRLAQVRNLLWPLGVLALLWILWAAATAAA
jgi:hypothetical protein